VWNIKVYKNVAIALPILDDTAVPNFVITLWIF